MVDKEILYFGSLTCGPCKKLYPLIEDIAFEEGIQLTKFTLQSHKYYFDKYKITGLPTVIFKENGKEKGRLLGMHKVSDYLELFGSKFDYS